MYKCEKTHIFWIHLCLISCRPTTYKLEKTHICKFNKTGSYFFLGCLKFFFMYLQIGLGLDVFWYWIRFENECLCIFSNKLWFVNQFLLLSCFETWTCLILETRILNKKRCAQFGVYLWFACTCIYIYTYTCIFMDSAWFCNLLPLYILVIYSYCICFGLHLHIGNANLKW